MRILMISATLGDAFGQERVLRDSSKALRENQHEVFFLSDIETGPIPPCEGFHFISGLSQIGTLSSPFLVRKICQELNQFLSKVNPDVVHFIDQFDFRILNSVIEKYPTVLTAHTVSPTCPASSRFTPQSEGYCTQRSGLSCFSSQKKYGCLNNTKGLLRKWHLIQTFLLRKKVMKKASVLGAISPYIKKTLLRDGYSENKIVTLTNPIEFKEAEPLQEAPKNLLLIASRLVPLKGIEYALIALSKLLHYDWTLWICGSGSYQTVLEEWVRNLNLSGRVHFKGFLNREPLNQAMKSSRFFIQTNVGPEGFGLSVAEALAQGTPVVGFDIPAINELVLHNQNGFLIPLKDTNQLAKAFENLLVDDLLRKRFSENAFQIQSKFNIEKHLKETLYAYQLAQFNFALDFGTSKETIDIGLLNSITHRN